MATLLRICDREVQERQAEFRRQLDVAPPDRIPSFVFKPATPYTRGTCFSCGDRLDTLRFGRCWRCSLAWRLACRLAINVEVAEARDTARLVA